MMRFFPFPISIATFLKETNSFTTIMQLINTNSPWKNKVKQKKINQEKLWWPFIFNPIAKDPEPRNGVKKQHKLRFWSFY